MKNEPDPTVAATEPELTAVIYGYGHGILTMSAAVAALLEGNEVQLGFVRGVPTEDSMIAQVNCPNVTVRTRHEYSELDRHAVTVGFEIALSSGKLVSLADASRFSSLLVQAQHLQLSATGALVAAGRFGAKS